MESREALAVRRRYGVPEAARLRVDGREALAWLPGYEASAREVAAHPDLLARSALGGRRRLGEVAAPDGCVLVREYVKGGLLRHLRGPGLRGPWRPLAEFALHRRLLAAGVPVAEAVGAVVLRRPLGWRGFLLLREVEGAVDLESLLYAGTGHAGKGLREVLQDAGRAVRRLHDAGVPHPDLHPKNLLLAPDGRVLVLDLDKARPCPALLPEEARLANLARLGRAVEKHRLKGLRVGPREALSFLAGYAGSLRAGRAWLERLRSRLGRGLWLRRAWWRLAGEARPWVRAREGEGT